MKRLVMMSLVLAAYGVYGADAAKPAPRPIKACVMQPPYALDVADIEKSMQWEFDALKKCDPSLDLIVLPEASDRQARVGSREQAIAAARLK